MLVLTVKIGRNDARSDVNVIPYVRIPEIRQVFRAHALSDDRAVDFNKASISVSSPLLFLIAVLRRDQFCNSFRP